MELTVLIDNNTLIDRYFLGEPGLCFFIREERGILFDLGYSAAFIRNAQKLGLDLLQTDSVVLSHGHLDHTWGLDPLIRMHTEALIEGRPVTRAGLVAHPLVFETRSAMDLPQIGSLVSESKVADCFDLHLTDKPCRLSENMVFLGEIRRCMSFEPSYAMGRFTGRDGAVRDDFLPDDSALVYRSATGLVVIAGCAHSGICNIVEQARRVCGEERVRSVIGGFHLLDPEPARLEGTVTYLSSLNLESLYACHCTDLKSKIALAAKLPLREVGVGLRLEF
jgi:7,8-dihydropterin-6-yl-methyl-4-(beta-D-ribofuranosyl)aminobenzene 5'-phosphate synthase